MLNNIFDNMLIQLLTNSCIGVMYVGFQINNIIELSIIKRYDTSSVTGLTGKATVYWYSESQKIEYNIF